MTNIPTPDEWSNPLSKEFERQFGKIKKTVTMLDFSNREVEVEEAKAKFYVAIGILSREA